MRLKDVPNDVGDTVKKAGGFVGKHKWWFIGGAVAIAGVAFVSTQQKPTATTEDTSFPYTSSFAPVGSGAVMPSSGGGGGGSSLPTDSQLPGQNKIEQAVSSFTGAFGTYSGIASDTAAALDLARQNLEYQYNGDIYNSTIDANSLLASMNLNAYNSALSYGTNAGTSNNSLALAAINAGYAPTDVDRILGTSYGYNPVTPNAYYNSPGYYTTPGTFGTGVTPGVGPQNPNVARPAPVAAPVSRFANYVETNTDLAAYYHGHPDIVNYWADKGGEEGFGAYHYSEQGQSEGRLLT